MPRPFPPLPESGRVPRRRPVRAWLTGRRAGVMAGLLAVGLACAIGAAAVHAAQAKPTAPPVSLEYAVKATYLYKLAPFVTWPPGEFASTNAPFTICVVGNDPFDGYLENAVTGRGFAGHPFSVRRLVSLTPDAHCQIAFLAQLPAQDIRQALDAVSGQPVLTVVDSATPDREGIVQFVIRQGRVGFEINVGAAARNHLAISSKLLSLALAVRGPS